MNIINKIITYYSFFVVFTTNNIIRDKFLILLTNVLNIPKIITKKNILVYLNNIYKETLLLKNEHKDILSFKEKSYLKTLLNYLLQVRRFFTSLKASDLINTYSILTEKDLLEGIKQLSQDKKIKNKILFLHRKYVFDYKISKPTKRGVKDV